MTDFTSWENDAFCSADIEELNHIFKRVEEEHVNDLPFEVVLTFPPDRADRYLKAVRHAARGQPSAVSDLLSFCAYVSEVLGEKVRERRG